MPASFNAPKFVHPWIPLLNYALVNLKKNQLLLKVFVCGTLAVFSVKLTFENRKIFLLFHTKNVSEFQLAHSL